MMLSKSLFCSNKAYCYRKKGFSVQFVKEKKMMGVREKHMPLYNNKGRLTRLSVKRSTVGQIIEQ